MQMPPSFARTADGRTHGPWTFARHGALATGAIGRGRGRPVGKGFRPVETIDEFARSLPPETATTSEIHGVGVPDFGEDLARHGILAILVRILRSKETGVLFLERDDKARKELYFVDGKLHHVASSDASELLGMYLVRRGKLAREEPTSPSPSCPATAAAWATRSSGSAWWTRSTSSAPSASRAATASPTSSPGARAACRSPRPAGAPRRVPLDLDIPRLLLAGLGAVAGRRARARVDAPPDSHRVSPAARRTPASSAGCSGRPSRRAGSRS